MFIDTMQNYFFFFLITTVVRSQCVGAVHNSRLSNNNRCSYMQGEIEVPFGNHAVIIMKNTGVFYLFHF